MNLIKSKFDRVNDKLINIVDSCNKNILDTSKIANTNIYGVTLTNNNDGSLTLNGTNTKGSNFIMVWNMNEGIVSNGTNLTIEQQIKKPNPFSAREQVVIDYGIEGNTPTTEGFQLQIVVSRDGTSADSTILGAPSLNETRTYQFSEPYKYVYFRLLITAEFINSSVTFRPMICRKELYDISPKVVPCITNLLNNVPVTVVDNPIILNTGFTLMTTGSQVYKQGEHIFGNIVIKCDNPIIKGANTTTIGTLRYPPSIQYNCAAFCGSQEYRITGLTNCIINAGVGVSVRYDFGEEDCLFLKIPLNYKCSATPILTT